jgi:hypothetical protein
MARLANLKMVYHETLSSPIIEYIETYSRTKFIQTKNEDEHVIPINSFQTSHELSTKHVLSHNNLMSHIVYEYCQHDGIFSGNEKANHEPKLMRACSATDEGGAV